MHHFQNEGKPKSTIYNIIDRYLTTNSTNHIKSGGHPTTVSTGSMQKNCNISEPFVSEGAISADVYLEECVKGRLLSLMDKLYDRDAVLFWPDMATAYYSRKVTSFQETENVELVPKVKNAPMFPK